MDSEQCTRDRVKKCLGRLAARLRVQRVSSHFVASACQQVSGMCDVHWSGPFSTK